MMDHHKSIAYSVCSNCVDSIIPPHYSSVSVLMPLQVTQSRTIVSMRCIRRGFAPQAKAHFGLTGLPYSHVCLVPPFSPSNMATEFVSRYRLPKYKLQHYLEGQFPTATVTIQVQPFSAPLSKIILT